MDRQTILSKAKAILLHPNFNQLNPVQIQQVFQSLLASGVTKDDIAAIVLQRESQPQNYDRSKLNYLEKLPRDAFKHMVQVGEISGMDLVNLCNTSPKLRTYCLTDKKDVNGKLLKKQEIYSLALEKMGIKLLPKDEPNLLYRKVASGFQVSSWDLIERKLTTDERLNNIIKVNKTISNKVPYLLTSTGKVLVSSNTVNPEILNAGRVKDMSVTRISTITGELETIILLLDSFQNLNFFKEKVMPKGDLRYFYAKITDLKGLNPVPKIKRIFTAYRDLFAIQTEDDTIYYYICYLNKDALEFALLYTIRNVKFLAFGENYGIYVDKSNKIFKLTRSNSNNTIEEIPNTMGNITKVVCYKFIIFFSTDDGNLFMMSTESSESVQPYIAKNIGSYEDLNDFTITEGYIGRIVGRYAQVSIVTKRKLITFPVVISLVWDYGEISGGEEVTPVSNPLFLTPGDDKVYILSIPE